MVELRRVKVEGLHCWGAHRLSLRIDCLGRVVDIPGNRYGDRIDLTIRPAAYFLSQIRLNRKFLVFVYTYLIYTMDPDETGADFDDVAAVVSAYQDSIALSNTAAAIAAVEEDSGWEYRPPHDPFGPLARQVNPWEDEENGGLNDYAFSRYTRFTKAQVKSLAEALDLPIKYEYDSQGYAHVNTRSSAESLLIFLWKAAQPNTLETMVVYFGRSPAWLSRVFNGVLEYLWTQYNSRIRMDTDVLLTPDRIKEYCRAIAQQLDTVSEKIFGFIDGTDVFICRPGELDQRSFYSGYHAHHTITSLAIILPNGLFGSVLRASLELVETHMQPMRWVSARRCQKSIEEIYQVRVFLSMETPRSDHRIGS